MRGRVLIVAGSDSGGGAGIQADIKTVTALGGYAATAITALTAQNTLGVFGVVAVEPSFIVQQMEVVLSDIGADAIKTGMLHDAAVVHAVAETIEAEAAGVPLVVDPVMVAKGGEALLKPEAVDALQRHLVAIATIVTPNAPEAAALTGLEIDSAEKQRQAARALLDIGAKAALVKGGHLAGEVVTDVLATAAGVEEFTSPRLDTANTHGTGCTLASAVATGLAQAKSVHEAVATAHAYVFRAIAEAPGLGRGHGPLNHTVTIGGRSSD
ncbi:MAG: bifunctional hydroxymethylpyrimidine kinase/phosphomethylpyrimidine kinase [Alphaproteobacteria bacterium]